MNNNTTLKYDFAFTSTNVILLVNNKFLNSVQEVLIKDKYKNNKTCTNIILKRYVFDRDEEIIDEMRTSSFSFVLKTSGESNAGYVAPYCSLENFEMYLEANHQDNHLTPLEQKIVIKTDSFIYVPDARPETLKMAEETDTANLIEALRQAQDRNKIVIPNKDIWINNERLDKLEAQTKNVQDEEMIFMNAKTPTQRKVVEHTAEDMKIPKQTSKTTRTKNKNKSVY
jgi:hypothetical protein